MQEMFKVINEYEARGVKTMYFNNYQFDIEKDEVEDFEEYGYKVEYIESVIKNGVGLVNRFSITRC